MLRSTDWSELGLRICQEAKERSREDELFALQNSGNVPQGLIGEFIEGEKRYRSYLDQEIERIKRRSK